MAELSRAFARLIDGIPAGFRWVIGLIGALFVVAIGLWLVVALLGVQGRLNLIGSGLLLIGLLVVLVSGLLGSFRDPATMLWSGLALLVFAVLLALPWDGWWSGLGPDGAAPGGSPVPGLAEPPPPAARGTGGVRDSGLVQALTDRGISASGLAVFDVWLIFMVLLNAVLLAKVAGGGSSVASWARANGFAVFALLLAGLVLSHWPGH
ncbi:MAG: hypothetical protein EA420_16330 [Candidatus Competibacteraceae bacterium]|nr:MAG: hypothetical protein EA420_16330 [Candidatus Competibacteraceae bacterium]